MTGQAGALVLAAGRSQRLGQDKTLLPLLGRPLLSWTLAPFQACLAISEVVLVLNSQNWERGREIAAAFPKVRHFCLGGERRGDSVWQGLQEARGWEWVVVHDGARPCLTPALIEQGLQAAQDTGAALAAVPAQDTIKLVSGLRVESSPPREGLWLAQTPQVFRFDLLWRAYQGWDGRATDDASLVEALGHPVKVFMGSYHNIKVTTAEDLVLAEAVLRGRDGF